MKKSNLYLALALYLVLGCSSDRGKKVSYLDYKAPVEIQRHFNHPVRWDAQRQERWVNGKLRVIYINGTPCLRIEHDPVEPPKGASHVSLK